jgi:hypothetical protein
VRNQASQPRYTGGSNEAGASMQRCRPPDGSSEDAPVRIRAAVFFDGTLNNRKNVELGQQRVFRGDSYRNHFTNIAILEKYHQPNCEYDISFATYVEGVGTTDGEGDTKIAAALGIWKTGLLDKVQVAVTRIINRIVQITKKGAKIDCIHLDSFGFSRGAAAARNFVYQTLCEEETLKLKLAALGYTVNDVRVEFVGLFDTVASYGLDHENDTDQLHLDAIQFAENVVQLAAADEHRKNFPLTNVDSARQGQQFFLPGAHSDIGGGYADEVDEIDLRLTGLKGLFGISKDDKAALYRERQWLLKLGWYTEAEIANNESDDLKVTRRGISNLYSRIPLKMMAHHAQQKEVFFTEELLSENKVPPPLKAVEQLLGDSPASSPDYWTNLTTGIMKCLRHDYLHFSAYYGSTVGCHDPEFAGDDPVQGRRKRGVIDG